MLSDPSVGGLCKRDIELALLRFRRIRLVSDTPALIRDLEAVRPSSPTDFHGRIKRGIVHAEIVLYRFGDFASARGEFEVLEQELRPVYDEFLYALVASGLAVANTLMGDVQRAEDYCQDCISIFRRYGNDVLYANSLNNLALLRKITCDYNRADRLYKRALSIYTKHRMDSACVLAMNNIAVLKMKTGEWDCCEHYLRKAIALRTDSGLGKEAGGEFLGKEEVNLAHLKMIQRDFEAAEHLAQRFLAQPAPEAADKLTALSLEFLGEGCMEQCLAEEARDHLRRAAEITLRIAPQSDIMTEVLRRKAQLCLRGQDPQQAKNKALECIRLCVKIRDKHEMGAALRVVAEANMALGLKAKATAAFEASINTLKSIGECYELMRSCISYSAFLIETNSRDADIYLLEARQLCRKLNLDFFLAQVMLLTSKYEYANKNFDDATTCLKRATELCDNLQACDRRALRPAIREWYERLEKAILKETMESAEKLKSIGRIYEEARFPIEELRPELATEVARNVRAESLFLAARKNGGYRIPLRYNLSNNDAKHVLRRQVKLATEELFESRDPKICEMMNGKTLVCVPGQTGNGYVLCTVIEEGGRFTPRDLEFLFASVEALERAAEEYTDAPTIADTNDFLDEGESLLSHPGGYFKNIITLDPELIKTIRLAERASQSTVPILFEGETGVGKELFARAAHANSPRREKGFVAINAGGVPLTLLESQLFGHVKGAFTDAVTDRTGLVEEARGGVLFFDEVGEMSEELQVKLLRLLEDGEFRRLGENAVRHADIRVISATNKDLQERVEKGLFREDLFFRLATVRLRIPPLRERKRDIEFLVRHFLIDGFERVGKAKRPIHVDMKALEAFEIYRWPGNVRELKNEIMRILSLMGEAEIIRFGMLSDRIKEAFKSRGDGGVLSRRVERYERRLILKALEENEWNRSKTADRIGIPRTTLLFKMKQLNIIS
jgi:DNA-binding NtrC family response regulator